MLRLMVGLVMMGLLGTPAGGVEGDWFAGDYELLADYNSELRGADGRLDVEEMVDRLKQLRVTTYMYLIWHRETDWEDLKLFLPAAREVGIDVWAYLVPPSESPPKYGTRYSEPFRLDYLRWGTEIGSLSREHPNLKAFVIDDFYTNQEIYTPEYVGRMRQRARSMNSEMKFLPLMYYRQMDSEFIRNYGPVIDGVVAAYPPDAAAVQSAWMLLNDRTSEPERASIVYPWQTRSDGGYYGSLQRRFTVTPSPQYMATLVQRDDFTASTAGYHFKQLLVDGTVVWEEDVALGSREWKETRVDLSTHVQGKQEVGVTFRVYDKKAVSNFGVEVEVRELSITGTAADSTQAWQTDTRGPFEVLVKPEYKAQGSFHLPLVVMIAASPSSFVKRNGEPGTADRYAEKLQMAITQMRAGFAEGVVTYTLPKYTSHEYYFATWQLYLKTLRSSTADFDADGDVDFDDFILFAGAYGRQIGRSDHPNAAYDLDVDGQVGFTDFLIFASAYASSQ
jgi:hypothetical protein